MIQAKGSVLNSRLKFVASKMTPEQKSLVIGKLSPEFQKDIQKGILAICWYPISYVSELVEAIDQVAGNGDKKVIPAVGNFAAQEALNTLYKVFVRFGSPDFILKRGATVWRQYYSEGDLVVTNLTPKHAQMKITGMDPQPHAFCLNLLGWLQGSMDYSGVPNKQVTLIKCWHNGHDHLEYDGTWG